MTATSSALIVYEFSDYFKVDEITLGRDWALTEPVGSRRAYRLKSVEVTGQERPDKGALMGGAWGGRSRQYPKVLAAMRCK